MERRGKYNLEHLSVSYQLSVFDIYGFNWKKSETKRTHQITLEKCLKQSNKVGYKQSQYYWCWCFAVNMFLEIRTAPSSPTTTVRIRTSNPESESFEHISMCSMISDTGLLKSSSKCDNFKTSCVACQAGQKCQAAVLTNIETTTLQKVSAQSTSTRPC